MDKCKYHTSASVRGFTEVQEYSFERPESTQQFLFSYTWYQTMSWGSKTSVKLPTRGPPSKKLNVEVVWLRCLYIQNYGHQGQNLKTVFLLIVFQRFFWVYIYIYVCIVKVIRWIEIFLYCLWKGSVGMESANLPDWPFFTIIRKFLCNPCDGFWSCEKVGRVPREWAWLSWLLAALSLIN